MIVMKFGGTSVESAAAIERVAGIVGSRLELRPLVVVSAMGQTTNRLLAAAGKAAAANLEDALRDLEELQEFHRREAGAVIAPAHRPEMEALLEEHFEQLESAVEAVAAEGRVTPRLWDEAASFGERLSSALLVLAFRNFGLPAVHLDARQVIITDDRHTQALPLYSRTYARLKEKAAPLVEQHGLVVMGGFIGSTSAGVTTTLGRGGSDFSAALAGAGTGAAEIQIWTDVDGMLTCDPRILPGGHLIRVISFEEAAELAYFGAKVLHPATVLPAVEKNIPVRILNSRRPEARGTLVAAGAAPSSNPVKSISCKKGVTMLNVRSLRMLMAYGFLRRIFEVFDQYRTPVDMVSTSEVSVSLTIDQTHFLDEITADLSRIAEVTVSSGQAVVCLVGGSIRETPGVPARVFTALSGAGVNVRMISQGASRVNIGLLVEESDLERAVGALHRELFAELDPEVFEV
jgi:aspartate kinase